MLKGGDKNGGLKNLVMVAGPFNRVEIIVRKHHEPTCGELPITSMENDSMWVNHRNNWMLENGRSLQHLTYMLENWKSFMCTHI